VGGGGGGGGGDGGGGGATRIEKDQTSLSPLIGKRSI
jgi:hypothetical protein